MSDSTRVNSYASDEELEARIHDANCAMLAAKSKSLQRYWAHRVAELVAMRSPERIRQMEVERGISTT